MSVDKLYPYEKVLVETALDPSIEKCKIIVPTGGGKGVICRHIFERKICSDSNRLNQFIGVVFTPRIMLNKQWVLAFIKDLNKTSRPVNYIFVSSESMSRKMTDEIEIALYERTGAGVDKPISTTNSDDIKKAIENNRKQGVNTVVISTYHSNLAIRKTDLTFDIAVYDEAHYVPGRDDPRWIRTKKNDLFASTKVKALKKIFTSATEKIGGVGDDGEYRYKGRGMDNPEHYGYEIFGWEENGISRRVSPRDLVNFGSILEPIVHIISTDANLGECKIDEDIDNINSINISTPLTENEHEEKARVIVEAFKLHDSVVKETSAEPSQIGGKIQVVCAGSAEIRGLMDSKVLKDFVENEKIYLYCISSSEGTYMPGKKNARSDNKAKEEMLDSLNSLSPSDKAIILHIDIMTCGLDIPALTGVMFFRYCKKIKLLQNIGRACRLHDKDKERWLKGKIGPKDKTKYIKPNFYIILPAVLEDMYDFMHRFGDIIHEVRESFEFNSYEYVHIGNEKPKPSGTGDGDEILTPVRNVRSELNRNYHQVVESRKDIKRKRKDNKEDEYVEEMIKRGDEDEMGNYIDGLLL